MSEVSPGTTPDINSSPLPNPSESVKDMHQNKKTLMVGAGLVIAMLVLVGVTFYSLRFGSSTSTTSPSSTQPSQSSASDKVLDDNISQVNSDFSNIDTEVNSVNAGLNDQSADLTY